MKIYTKTGDKGETGYLGKGRLSKSDPRIEAYGTIDELNSCLGLCIQYVSDQLKSTLVKIQNKLFDIGTELASQNPTLRISDEDVSNLESEIDKLDSTLDPLKSFILPGGSNPSSWLHLARTIARRSERRMVEFSKLSEINPSSLAYINRLSDLLFIMARSENNMNGISDIEWKS